MLEIDDDPVEPDRAMICTVWMLGMVAIAPKVGRPSRHILETIERRAGMSMAMALLRS